MFVSQSAVEKNHVICEKRRIREYVQSLFAEDLERPACDHLICRRIMAAHWWKSLSAVFAYRPYHDEVNILPLLEEAKKQGMVVAMASRRASAEVLFFDQAGHPVHLDHYEASRSLVVTPSRACTKDGARLGRGRGAYDCLRKRYDAYHFLSPIYSFQLLDRLPISPYDFPIQSIITDKEMFSSWKGVPVRL